MVYDSSYMRKPSIWPIRFWKFYIVIEVLILTLNVINGKILNSMINGLCIVVGFVFYNKARLRMEDYKLWLWKQELKELLTNSRTTLEE